VDKGFVDDLSPADTQGCSILRAVIQLSEALGVMSVAEGVETPEQAQVPGRFRVLRGPGLLLRETDAVRRDFPAGRGPSLTRRPVNVALPWQVKPPRPGGLCPISREY